MKIKREVSNFQRDLFLLSFVTIFFLLQTKFVSAATAKVTSLQNISGQNINSYGLFEASFELDKTYPNPYYYYDASDTRASNPSRMTWVGEDGVTIDAVLTLPNGSTQTVPAFFFQDYKRIKFGIRNILGKTNNGSWRIRYTPKLAGTYRYYIRVTDKEGTTRYPASVENTFSVNTNSTSKGFVKVSESDPRFMEFENGETFVPISRGQVTGLDYEEVFPTFKQNGVNLTRIWDHADYSLGVEGASTSWVSGDTIDGAARGVIVGTGAYQGLRSANPTTAWYQRIAISEPSRQHKVEGYVRGSGRIRVSNVQSNLTLGSTVIETGVGGANWTYVSATFTPGTDRLAIYLPTGSSFDTISVGPVNASGAIEYNILTDGDIERHFAKDNPGNDPNQTITLARPLGNFFNQDEAYILDKILASAESNDVKVQLASASGPWFTWPGNPESPDEWNWGDKWVLNSWKRNFRYRVARWGYSQAILAWENHNEHGHVTPSTSAYDFYQTYGRYQKETDIYGHLRTTSQGSQTYSPNFWSSSAFDLANYHDYMMLSRYPASLTNDEANFVSKFAWCLGTKGAYCEGLGLGDGTSWISGVPLKPWVWGEIGVGVNWNDPNYLGSSGEGARRQFRNSMWSGLMSPIFTSPIVWYDDDYGLDSHPDPYSTNVYNDRKIASNFFAGVNLSNKNPIFMMTQSDRPTGYAGEVVTSNNTKARVLAAKSQDRKLLVAWVQHRDHTWFNASTVPASISPSISFPGMLNDAYTVEIWNTTTGTKNTSTVQVVNTTLTVTVPNLSSDYALKIFSEPITVLPTNTPGAPIATATTVQATATNSPVATATPAINIGNGDVNGDGQVNATDARMIFANFFRNITNTIDQYADGVINSFDFSVSAFRIRNNPTATVAQNPSATATRVPATSTPRPSNTPPVATVTNSQVATTTPVVTLPPSTPGTEWTQHGQNAQRTSYSAQAVPTPWKWKWTWNGPDNPNANPGSGTQSITNKIRIPKNIQPVAGGGRVYTSAGSNGVYAVDMANGNQVWNSRPGGNINSSAAYDSDTQSVFVVSATGNLYKLNASTGATSGTFSSGSSSTLPLPPAINGNNVYFSMGNSVYAINKNTMLRVWAYAAGSTLHTPPSYSATRDIVIAVSQDLNVHAIKNSDGARAWRVKPTVLVPGNPESSAGNDFADPAYGWPVVADRTGLVLIKYQLDWDTLFAYPNGGIYPNTNSQIRAFLRDNPDQQALFALDLDDGSNPFISNVGHGGFGDGNVMPMGPQPVIKTVGNTEVAYVVARGGTVAEDRDGRWDSRFAEMLLDDSVSGFAPGDIRFIEYNFYGNWERFGNGWENTSANPTDEQPQLSMAGDQLLGGHWMAAKNLYIQNRGAGYGTYDNPILSAPLPHIVTSTNSNATEGCTFSTSHYCSNTTLVQEGDTRLFAGPGFYIYYGNYGYSGNNSGSAIYDRFWSEYATWIVSNGTAIFRSTDGALMAFGSGNPTSQSIKNVNQNVAGISTNKVSDVKSETIYKITADVAQNYIDKNVVMSGTISQTFDNGKAFYIALGTRSQNGFVIRIMKEDKANFEYNLKEKFAVGSKITVTGKMGSYQGDPVMYVDDPAEIIIVR